MRNVYGVAKSHIGKFDPFAIRNVGEKKLKSESTTYGAKYLNGSCQMCSFAALMMIVRSRTLTPWSAVQCVFFSL